MLFISNWLIRDYRIRRTHKKHIFSVPPSTLGEHIYIFVSVSGVTQGKEDAVSVQNLIFLCLV